MEVLLFPQSIGSPGWNKGYHMVLWEIKAVEETISEKNMGPGPHTQYYVYINILILKNLEGETCK